MTKASSRILKENQHFASNNQCSDYHQQKYVYLINHPQSASIFLILQTFQLFIVCFINIKTTP